MARKFTRRALLSTAAAAAAGLGGCNPGRRVCEAATVNGINWIPDVMQPVSWGFDHVGPATGAPMRMMIAYPSAARLEDAGRQRSSSVGSTYAAPQDLTFGADVVDERPILRHCLTLWPLVLLLHGGDNVIEPGAQYLYWRTMASALARSGCVVVTPRWTTELALVGEQSAAAAQVWKAAEWVRTGWRHAAWVDPARDETLFVGHSLGGQIALTLAVDRPQCAGVVSLGGWQLYDPSLERIWAELRAPVLFMRTRWLYDEKIKEAQWRGLPGDKYLLTYAGDHFDYLDRFPHVVRTHLGRVPPDTPGACSAFPWFPSGLVSLFAARYLRSTSPPPASLEPQFVTPTSAQLRYMPSPAEWTTALDLAPGCVDIRMRWVVDGQAGHRTFI